MFDALPIFACIRERVDPAAGRLLRLSTFSCVDVRSDLPADCSLTMSRRCLKDIFLGRSTSLRPDELRDWYPVNVSVFVAAGSDERPVLILDFTAPSERADVEPEAGGWYAVFANAPASLRPRVDPRPFSLISF